MLQLISILSNLGLGQANIADAMYDPAPVFPAACIRPGMMSATELKLKLSYSLTDDGFPQDVRVVKSSDACLDSSAVAFVRSWIFRPIDERQDTTLDPVREISFSFSYGGGLDAATRRPSPIQGERPDVSGRCHDRSKRYEMVRLRFNINEEGRTADIRVEESARECLNEAAIAAMETWRYAPKFVDEEPVAQIDLEQKFFFDLPKRYSNQAIRNSVRMRLERIERNAATVNDATDAIAKLADFEAEYGGTLSRNELSRFLGVRSYVYANAEKYDLALDDMRVLAKMGRLSQRGLVNLASLEQALLLDGRNAVPYVAEVVGR